MSDHDDGHAVVPVQLAERLIELCGSGRIQARDGLVEHEDFMSGQKAPGKKNALLLSSGELAVAAAGQVFNVKLGENIRGLLLFFLGEERPPALVPQKTGHDDLADRRRKIPLHLAHLRQISDTAASLAAIDADLALQRVDQPEHGLHERGFAGAVLADDTHIIAGENLKAQVRYHRLVVVPQSRVIAADDGCVLVATAIVLHGILRRVLFPCFIAQNPTYHHTRKRSESQYIGGVSGAFARGAESAVQAGK